MRHFSTLLCILALGLSLEVGTSCKKETASPATSSNNVVTGNYKVNQQDTTSTGNYSSGDHNGCGNDNGGSHSYQY